MLTSLLGSAPPSAPSATTIVATASGIALTSLIVRSWWKAHQLSHIPGPKAPSLLFGHLLQTLGSVAKWKQTGQYPEPFLTWIEKYGDAIHIREFLSHVILLTDPKAVQHVLVTNGPNYPCDATTLAYFTDITFGVGLLSSEGSLHEKQRKMLNPLFTSSQVKKFVRVFDSTARRCCENILAKASESSTPIDLGNVIHELALTNIGLAAFGFDFAEYPDAHAAYSKYTLQLTPLILIGTFKIPGFTSFPLPELRRRREGQRALKKVMMDVIESKLARSKNQSSEDESNDLLDLILPNVDTHEALVHTMTFMSAGHKTTSSALGWIFATLSKHPEAVTRIREEYASAVAKHGSMQTWEAASELKFTMAVVQETLRLNAIAYRLMQRVAQADDNVPMFDGSSMRLPKGTTVQVNIAAMNRNPKYWTDAQQFNPERFVEGTTAWDSDLKLRKGKGHTFFFMPFGGGNKNCIGQRFALLQMQVVVATLISQFDFTLAPTADIRHKHTGAVVTPAKLDMIVRRVQAPCA